MWCIVGGITFFWGGIVFGMFGFPFLFSFSWFLTGIPSVFLALSIFRFGIQIVAVTVITIRTRFITVTWFTWGWYIFFRFPFAILFQFLPYTFLNMLAQQVKGHLEFFFATSTSVRVYLVPWQRRLGKTAVEILCATGRDPTARQKNKKPTTLTQVNRSVWPKKTLFF